MNIRKAERLAKKLIKIHCPDYTFEWSKATRTFGVCNRTHKTIKLSKALSRLNTQEHVEDTILHEIAHALTPGRGHDKYFYAMCNKLGARPQRCYSSKDVVVPKPKGRRLEYQCPGCQKIIYRRKLIGKKRTACGACCRANGGGWQERFVLEFKREVNLS